MQNLQAMMGQVKKIQAEMKQQLETLRVEAASGGGMVAVAMNGSKRVLSVKIDPEVAKSGDVEMLQDLVQAAVNAAGQKVDDAMSEKLGGMAGMLNLPGLF